MTAYPFDIKMALPHKVKFLNIVNPRILDSLNPDGIIDFSGDDLYAKTMNLRLNCQFLLPV
jgi:hypothetical protein